MTALEVPEGVRQILKMGQVAAALNVDERIVRGWLDSKALPSIQPGRPGSGRFIHASVLLDFAQRHGLRIDWSKAL